jgi:hypothetical protein
MAQGMPAGIERTLQVEGDCAIPSLLGRFPEWNQLFRSACPGNARPSGAVDQDIDSAETADASFYNILCGSVVRNRIVAGYGHPTQISEFLNNLVRRTSVQTDSISTPADIINHYFSALADHSETNLTAYSARTAGYDSTLPIQPLSHLFVSSRNRLSE